MPHLKTLTGLRGLSSLMIVCHHAYYFSSLPNQYKFFNNLWFFPGWALDIFFLLSGYSLSLGYGQDCGQGFSVRSFYQNRFARIAPLYYFCSALSMPFVFVGYGLNPHGEWGVYSLWTGIIENILGTTSWCVWYCSWSGPFCGPTWFISTLLFFYLCFPFILPRVMRLSNLQISRLLPFLFYLQLSMIKMTPFTNRYFPNPFPGLHPIGDWVTIRHPISRLPVFLMGVLAGIQHLRVTDGQVDKRANKNFIHDLLPWDIFDREVNNDEGEDKTAKIWQRKVNVNCGILLVGLIMVNIFSRWHNKKFTTTSLMDFVSVQCLLTVILGISRDKGYSIFSKICSSRPLQFLGDISAPLFLIHFWLMKLIRLLAYGSNGPLLPGWGVPIVILVSPILSWVVHVWIEEPARKLLRRKPGQVQLKHGQNPNGCWILAPFLYLGFVIYVRLSIWHTQPQWLKY